MRGRGAGSASVTRKSVPECAREQFPKVSRLAKPGLRADICNVSKAFTSEETPDVGPLTRSAPRLAAGEKRYVTPEGHANLQQRLDDLRVERARLLAFPETQRASLLDVDQRLAFLEATLRVLTVLGPDGAPDDRVAFARW